MNFIKTMVNAVISCFSKYACFDGRISRQEFWSFALFNVVAAALLYLSGWLTTLTGQGDSIFLRILCCYYILASALPTLAAATRRLHDTGRSGYYMLWLLLPVIGYVILAVYLAMPGEAAANRYGPGPQV